MSSPNAHEDPGAIACKLGALAPAERARNTALVRELLGIRPVSVAEIPEGYVLEYPGEPETLARLVEWIGLESQCCAFFAFDVSVAPRGGPVRLTWTAEEPAAKLFMAAMLAAARGTDPTAGSSPR